MVFTNLAGHVEYLCAEVPHAASCCVADDQCNEACADDPDCAPVCVADGECNAECADDPDCAPVCVADGECNAECAEDPDCGSCGPGQCDDGSDGGCAVSGAGPSSWLLALWLVALIASRRGPRIRPRPGSRSAATQVSVLPTRNPVMAPSEVLPATTQT
jgi:MYXO-CTERM domain-containing protein